MSSPSLSPDADAGSIVSVEADEARALLAGRHGPASAMAMRVVQSVARATGTQQLRRISSAHVDSCLYHGQAGLDFATRLVQLGGQVSVRTTSNVGSLDLSNPDLVHLDSATRRDARALMQAYTDLGCEQTFTCAPYQMTHRPAFGTHVAWAESNAIAFVNSVLGARTERYGDFLDIAAAITGLVPDVGLHTDAGRAADMVLDCTSITDAMWQSDVAWAALGAAVGEIAGTRVAVLAGVPGDLSDGGETEDHLKALAATVASTGGVALFHVRGVTPEAPANLPLAGLPVTAITQDVLRRSRDRLSTTTGSRLDTVSLGTPHFSVTEFARLACELVDGAPFHPDIEVYVSTSRAVLAEADRLGYIEPLRRAGGRVVTDTCTYVTPVLRKDAAVAMTNSGKWAWYAPGNLGVDVVFGTLRDCVESARVGKVRHVDPLWH